MRIAILGAGGIGGYYAGVLARSGHEVLVLARGENLQAIRARGIEVRVPGESFVTSVNASDDITRFNCVAWAILSVKTYSLADVAPSAAFLGNNGALILPLLNGVDIGDRLIQLGVPKENVLGGLTRIVAERVAPGIFERHGDVQQVVIGELDPVVAPARQSVSDRVRDIAEAFRRAGVDTRISDEIRTDLGRKFAFLAPVAGLCGMARSTIDPIRTTTLGRSLLERAIREVIAVARAHGVPVPESEVSQIMTFCDSLPATTKPSLLRDLEAGQVTEIEALSGAVSSMGRLAGIETPIHDAAMVAIGLASSERGF